jgi:phosphoserine phosphatase
MRRACLALLLTGAHLLAQTGEARVRVKFRALSFDGPILGAGYLDGNDVRPLDLSADCFTAEQTYVGPNPLRLVLRDDAVPATAAQVVRPGQARMAVLAQELESVQRRFATLTADARERGGQAREPLWYKHEYLRRLEVRIRSRLDGLRNGSIVADSLLVHQSRQLLDLLQQRGLKMYLASGTDEPFVKQEAALLQVDRYFGTHIYGALDDYKNFSKKKIIDRILRENQIPVERLLAFGDGYVEIQNTKEVGGVAVAVASDEANNGSGQMDEWKRQRLLGVGADVVIPDFRDAQVLLDYLLNDH